MKLYAVKTIEVKRWINHLLDLYVSVLNGHMSSLYFLSLSYLLDDLIFLQQNTYPFSVCVQTVAEMYVKRPKPAEDVEDLERANAEFLASRSQASVTLQKKISGQGGSAGDCGASAGSTEPQRKSRFKREREEARANTASCSTADAPPPAPLLRDLVVRS